MGDKGARKEEWLGSYSCLLNKRIVARTRWKPRGLEAHWNTGCEDVRKTGRGELQGNIPASLQVRDQPGHKMGGSHFT